MLTETFIRKVLRTALPALLGAALAALAGLSACTEGTTSGTETGTAISLRGRVLDADGLARPGVVARLSRVGLADTTDAAGRYHLLGEPGSADGDALDSVVFLLGGRRAAALPVEAWVDSLPDVRILQRTFSGRFSPAVEGIAKIEATLFLPAPARPMKAEFFHNRPVAGYSGYFFFPVAGKESEYAVVVDVYDSAGTVMGTSDTLRFDGLAGDLELPPFDPTNRRLRAEAFFSDSLGMKVREAAPGDTLFLGARAYPPRGARVTSWVWDNGDGTFPTSDGSLRLVVPPVHGTEIRLILRVGIDAGDPAEDTLRVKVLTRFEHMLRRPWRTLGRYHGQVFERFLFPERYHHGLVVHRGRVLAIGGLKGPPNVPDTLRDAWSTADGEAWTRVAEDAPASIRWLGSAVAREDTLWLPGSNARAREVWFSTDGATWTLATESAAYPPRIRPSTAVFGGKLWVVGGVDSLGQSMKDVWASEDGRTWTRMAEYKQFYGYSEPVWTPGSTLGATADSLFLHTPGRPGILYATATGAAWNKIHTDSLIAEDGRRGAGAGALMGFGNHLLLVGTSGMSAYDLEARRWRDIPNGDPDYAGGLPRAGYVESEGAGLVFFRDQIWLTGGWMAVGLGRASGGIRIHEWISTLEW